MLTPYRASGVDNNAAAGHYRGAFDEAGQTRHGMAIELGGLK
jgi:hypothetical protein